MSSDAFYVRIGEIDGDHVLLHCLTGFAGGLSDLATSRSFALGALLDAKRRAGDVSYDVGGAPEDVAAKRIEVAKRVRANASPLHDEVGSPELTSEAWHIENTPRFIASTDLLARGNALSEGELSEIAGEIEPLQDQGPWPHRQAAWKRLHRFDLDVQVTDAKYLAHLVVGHEFGTSAYDVWRE